MADQPCCLLLRPDMRALSDGFKTEFAKYYAAMEQRSNGMIRPVIDEDRFRQALKGAGISGPSCLKGILDLKRTTCSQIWNHPNQYMTGNHFLRLRSWATARMYPIQESPQKEVDPRPYEALLETLRGGEGEGAFSRETVIEYRLRCFAEYLRLLKPRQTALLMTICYEILGDQSMANDGRDSALDILSHSVSVLDDKQVRALFIITEEFASASDDRRPVTKIDQEYESQCRSRVARGALDAADVGSELESLGASEAMLRRYGASRIRDSLIGTDYGRHVDLLGLSELVATPNSTLYWALRNAQPHEDDESETAPITTSRPPSWAPFDVLREYVGLQD